MVASTVERTTPLAAAQSCFRVMGCAAQVMITGGTGAQLESAEARLRELESRWSRFVADSDITRANRAAGTPVAVHTDTLVVVERAVDAWKQTRGRFDITVLPALVHHGYRHSASGPATALAPRVSEQIIGVSGDIVVDESNGTLTVPAGAAIDLGGIGKGFAADLVVGELIESGVRGALVNIGGDIAARGFAAPGDAPWEIGVEDPLEAPALICTVRFVEGAVATSGTTVRQWTTPSGATAHHLIDPTTARPATTSLLTASVIASDAATAEAFATAAMMADGPTAVELLERAGLAGMAITRDGRTHCTESWAAFAC